MLVEVVPPHETVQRAPFTVSATVTFAPLPSVARMGAVVLGLVRTLTPAHAVTFGTASPKTSFGATTDAMAVDRTGAEERESEQRGDGQRSRTDRAVGGDSQLGNLGVGP